ncbi:MAG: DUF6516 family protein [bacterium]
MIDAYFTNIKSLFILSDIIKDYAIRREKIRQKDGFIRIKAILSDNDTLEVFEFVKLEDDTSLKIETYKLHWQSADGKTIMRWDNAEHYPTLDNFPHHVHIGENETPKSSPQMSIENVLKIIKEKKLEKEE